MKFPNWCILYKNVEEKIENLFLHCDFAREVWEIVNSNLHHLWVPPHILDCMIEQWRLEDQYKKSKLIWGMIPPHIFWVIYKERNNKIFKECSENLAKTWKYCLSLLHENIDYCIQLDPTKYAKSFTLWCQLLLELTLSTSDADKRIFQSSRWHGIPIMILRGMMLPSTHCTFGFSMPWWMWLISVL